MTEPPLLPPPDPNPPVEAVVPPPTSSRRSPVPWLYGIGFLILAAAVFYLWQFPAVVPEAADSKLATQAISKQIADIDARLNNLQQRPTVDTDKVMARLDALEGRVADQAHLAARLDTLSGRFESLSGRDQTGIDAATHQVGELNSRITALEASTGNVGAVVQRLNRIAMIQQASLALAAGRAIGELPNAPDALTRYAHAQPPTEAELRLRFPDAAKAALAAGSVDKAALPLWGRMWDRAQGLVTIRRGENVVVGSHASDVLNTAQTALDAGDLAGAVDALSSLSGPQQQAISVWRSDAKALLAARSALAQLAAQA